MSKGKGQTQTSESNTSTDLQKIIKLIATKLTAIVDKAKQIIIEIFVLFISFQSESDLRHDGNSLYRTGMIFRFKNFYCTIHSPGGIHLRDGIHLRVIKTISCNGSRLKAVASHEQSGASGNKYFKLFFDRASSNLAFQLLKSVLKLLLKNPQSITKLISWRFSETFELATNKLIWFKVLKIWKVENKKDSIVGIITLTFMIKGVYRLIYLQYNGIIDTTVSFPLSELLFRP